MASLRYPTIALAFIVTVAAAANSRADETGEFLDFATLQPESRAAMERVRRPITYSQIVEVSHARRVEKPLVDFAFSFSRTVVDDEQVSNLAGNFARTRQGTSAKSMQHQDVLIAELEARESQIASDMKAEAVVEDSAPVPGRITIPADDPAPVKLDPIWLEVAPPTEPQKGWSGMTIAIRGAAMRFSDEGGTQYR